MKDQPGRMCWVFANQLVIFTLNTRGTFTMKEDMECKTVEMGSEFSDHDTEFFMTIFSDLFAYFFN